VPADLSGDPAGLTGILKVIDEIDDLLGDAKLEDEPCK